MRLAYSATMHSNSMHISDNQKENKRRVSYGTRSTRLLAFIFKVASIQNKQFPVYESYFNPATDANILHLVSLNM